MDKASQILYYRDDYQYYRCDYFSLRHWIDNQAIGDVTMSRRKQPNPKSIKHEGEEEGIERHEEDVPENTDMTGDIDSGKSSPGETNISSNDTSCDKISQSQDYTKCSRNSKMLSSSKFDINKTSREGSKNDQRSNERNDADKNEHCESTFKDRHLSERDEIVDDSKVIDTECCDDSKVIDTECCDETVRDGIIADNGGQMSSRIEADIKRELSLSPAIDGTGDSDGGNVNRLNSTSFRYKLTNKSTRRNRSRSRSSSKSLGVSSSPDAQSGSSQSREEAERALVNQLQLPSDVLYLKQLEMTIQGTPSVGWVVCCAIPLPQGSSLGPFQGQLVPPEAVKVGDLIVQFTNKKGQQALMNVAGQSGGWLALLRTAAATADRNTHVYWEGGRIWCEVIADIDIGTELKATFSFQNDDDNDEESDDDVTRASEIKDAETPLNEDISGGVQHLQHPYQQQVAPGHAALIYGCPFCGVRFSSPRTLQGHLSFYCSKKTSDQIVTPVIKDRDKGSNQNKLPVEGTSVKQEPDIQLDQESNAVKQPATDSTSQLGTADLQSGATQVGRHGQVFKCKHCSYKADKLSSLNRHMRMHNNDKVKMTNLPSDERASCSSSDKVMSTVRSPNSETFCQECKIQFSNLHTYRCHKEHYCAQRRKKALADPSAFAAMFHSPFSFHEAAKVGIPSALQMAALNQGGLILPGTGAAASPGTAAVLLSAPVLTATGMANIAISMPTMLMPPMVTGQDVVAVLKSPRIKRSPEKQQPHPSSSQHSSHPLPLAHFLNLSATNQVDYKRALDELHKSKEIANIKTDSVDEDRPLDLTVTKKEIKFEHESSKDGIQSKLAFLQPDRDGALDARRMIRSSSQASSTSDTYQQLQDLKDESNSPPVSPICQGTTKTESDLQNDSFPSALNTQKLLRSDHITPNPMIIQVLPHPSMLVPPAGFLSMPLTLSPSAIRAAPLSPSCTPNGISKCADCNIVFYKHDNYLIHKKHYCSGKRRLSVHTASAVETAYLSPVTDIKVDPDTEQPSPPSAPQSPPLKTKKDPEGKCVSTGDSSQEANTSSPKHSSEVKYKFYCVPCRIKFSNSSILEAHKEYYCPAGKDSEQSVIVQTTSSEAVPSPRDDRDHTSPELHHDEFTCTRCNSIFVSARLLRLHICDGGFPCPHCDHVSITENRLAEHLKVHAPTKAYRCTICGYRGNTARGMRMHGKTHIDEGLDFTDENMLAYHEPALIPVVHSPYPGTATDTELLRLKNEPYKRRRSRKAYEKFDYPLPKVDIPQTCSLCGQNFANTDFLASHLKVHEIAASQFMTGLLKCTHCSYIAQTHDNLHSHFDANHTGSSRSKRPRLSSLDSEEQNNHGESSSPGMWRSPKKIENQSNASLVKDTTLTPEASDVLVTNPELDSRNGDNQLEANSYNHIAVKSEPIEEYKHDRDSSSKLSHFLQTPNQSPEPHLDDNSDNRQESISPLSNSSRPNIDSPSSTAQYEQQSGYLKCTDKGRQDLEPCKMETEPGEIIAVRVKPEPTYEDEETDIGHQFSSDSIRGHGYDQRAERLELNTSEMSSDMQRLNCSRSTKQPSNQNKSEELNRRSPVSVSSVAKLDSISPNSALNTPNFLINSPLHENPSHSPAVPITSSRLSVSSSSFQTIQSHLSTTSLAAVFPSHPPHAHAIPFPCTTPQIALPYLFLPTVQAGASLPIPCSPSVREDRSGGARYCQNCDISFSKHATYLAHKKYYCTARPRGEVQSSAKA